MLETVTNLPDYRIRRKLLSVKESLINHLKYYLLKEQWDMVSAFALEIKDIEQRLKQLRDSS